MQGKSPSFMNLVPEAFAKTGTKTVFYWGNMIKEHFNHSLLFENLQ